MELLGQRFAQYEILEKLGAGGMGEVYKARDSRLGRNVAIKVLSAQAASDESLKRRFLIEARAASALNHPYILTVYEIGQVGDYEYMVMEYVHGITLRQRLGQGHLELMEAMEIFLKVAEGLYKAHEAKIIHRDLKPENIMLTADGFVKILDFGLAKLEYEFAEKGVEDIKTDPNVIQGTVGYLAPEMIDCQPADVRTDIFAYGVMMYESLAGKLPFEGRNLAERLVNTMQAEPKPLSDRRGDLPPELEDIVKRCLAKLPDNRYQSLGPVLDELRSIKRELELEASISSEHTPRELLERIRRAQEGDSDQSLNKITGGTDVSQTRKILVKPESISTQPTISIKRSHAWRYALAGFAVALVIAGGLFGWYSYRQAHRVIPASTVKSGKMSLAVIYFENISHDDELKWLERGIAEMLTTNLAQFDTIDVLSSQQLYDLLRRYKQSENIAFDRDTAVEIARRANVRTFVTGTIVKVGNRIRLSVTLEDTATGKILYSDKAEGGNVDEIFAVVDQITVKLAEHLGEGKNKREISIADVTTESIAAFKHYEQGVEKVTKLHLNDAIQEFEKAISIDPNFAMAYLQLGIAKLRAEDESGTRKAIVRAVELIDRVAIKERLFIRGLEAVIEGHAEKRIDCFKELTERFPLDKESYRQLGMAYLADEQLDAAIKTFEETLKLDPDYSEGHNRLAYAYLAKGDFDLAISHAQKYLALMPNEPNPHDTAGDVYLIAGRVDEAMAEYQRVIELKPDFINYFAYWKVAGAYRVKGELDKAEAAYQQHLSLRKEGYGADSIKSLAIIALMRGNRAQTLSYLNQALDNEIARGQLTMAVLTAVESEIFYLEVGETAKAAEYAAKARQLLAEQMSQVDIFSRYNDRIVEINYLRLLLARGEFDKVDKELESFFEANKLHYTPFSRELLKLYARASREEAEGKYSEALASWQQLRAVSGLKRGYAGHIGSCFWKLNRLDEAKREFELLAATPIVMHQQAANPIGIEPVLDNLRANYYLGRIAESRGATAEAQQYYQNVARWHAASTIRISEFVDAEQRLK